MSSNSFPKSSYLWASFLIASLLLIANSSSANQTHVSAFDYVKADDRSKTTRVEQQHRTDSFPEHWRISNNLEIVNLDVGQSFQIRLPDAQALIVRIDKKNILANGDIQLLGTFSNGGRVIYTIGAKSSFASIQSKRHNWSIDLNAGNQQILIDNSTLTSNNVDLRNDIRISPELIAHAKGMTTEKFALMKKQALAKNEITTIDILIAYSKEFDQLFNSPTTRINQLIAFSNDAYQRSGILLKLRLVKTQEIAFNNSTNIGTLLDQATNSRGAFSSLGSLRNSNGADLVAVLAASANNFSSSGIAWVSGGFADTAFSVTRLSRGCCDSVFAHELGHNLGSGHEHRSANPRQSSPCGFNYTGYACGHGNAQAGWGTIMSYLDSRVIGHLFSNLDRDCLGSPCGIAEGQANPADNRTSFNITRLLVAKFRQDATPIIPDPEPEPDPEPDLTRPTKPSKKINWLTPILDLLNN